MTSKFLRSMYNKTTCRFGFCDIQNNQGLGKGYQPQPSASADNERKTLEWANGQIKSTGTWLVLISKFKGLKKQHRKADRTVGVNCFVFSNISSGKAFLQGMFTTEKRRYNLNNKDKIYIVYVIESAAYGVLFTSCLCQNPNERGTSE